MRVTEELKIFWNQLTTWQRAAVIAPIALIAVLLLSGWVTSLIVWAQVAKYEREAAVAKAEAKKYLEEAAKIAKEKVEAEKKLIEIEAKRDGKQTEAEKAEIATKDARLDYARTLREQRSDDPSTEQLCAELNALGYPCE